MKRNIIQTFSINMERQAKTLGYLEKWYNNRDNISDKINKAIEMYGAYEEQEEEEARTNIKAIAIEQS